MVGQSALEFDFICRLTLCGAFYGIEFVLNLIAFKAEILHVLVAFFKLAGDVVDVLFEGHDFLNVVLFSFFELSQLVAGTTHVFLSDCDLIVKILVFFADLLNCVLESIILLASVSVVLKNVFFLHFERSHKLLRFSFLVDKRVVLVLEQFICMGGLSEFLVYKSVFPRQCLDVFRQLRDFLRFELSKLCLLLQTLAKAQIVSFQVFDFSFTLKESALVVVLFTVADRHLMLHI